MAPERTTDTAHPLMNLERNFEDKLRTAVLDQAVAEARDAVAAAIDRSNEILRQSDYDVEFLIDDLEGPTVERRRDGFTIRWQYDNDLALIYEQGTSDHTIEGDPLSFVWEDPPQWVREHFEREGEGFRVFLNRVEVSGVDRLAYTEQGMRVLRQMLRS